MIFNLLGYVVDINKSLSSREFLFAGNLQAGYTDTELQTYWKAINNKSVATPVNVFDLMVVSEE